MRGTITGIFISRGVIFFILIVILIFVVLCFTSCDSALTRFKLFLLHTDLILTVIYHFGFLLRARQVVRRHFFADEVYLADLRVCVGREGSALNLLSSVVLRSRVHLADRLGELNLSDVRGPVVPPAHIPIRPCRRRRALLVLIARPAGSQAEFTIGRR